MMTPNSLKAVTVWRSRETVKNQKKVERRGEMSDQIGNYPVHLTAECHTMFVYCDFLRNETLGDTQTALLRAVPIGDNKRQRKFTRIQWRRMIKSSIHSLTIALRNEAGGLIPFLSRGRTNLTLQLTTKINSSSTALDFCCHCDCCSHPSLLHLPSKLCQFPTSLNWKLDEAVVLLVSSFHQSI